MNPIQPTRIPAVSTNTNAKRTSSPEEGEGSSSTEASGSAVASNLNKRARASLQYIRPYTPPSFTDAFSALRPPVFTSIASVSPSQAAQPHTLLSDLRYKEIGIGTFSEWPEKLQQDSRQCKQEYIALVDAIAGFANKHAKGIDPELSEDTLTAIQNDFRELKTKIDNDTFAQPGRILTVYNTGKAMFHTLNGLLADDNIPLQKRMNSIIAMTPSMDVCSGGVLTALSNAVLELTPGEFKQTIYRSKKELVEALISKFVSTAHPDNLLQPGNEVHFVNAYFNYIAPEVGMPRIDVDTHITVVQQDISDLQLEACKQTVLNRLTPALLAKNMAHNYLDRLQGVITQKPQIDLKGSSDYYLVQEFKNTVLNREYGPVLDDIHWLVDTATGSCDFIQQPTLIAKQILASMKEEKLVDYNEAICLPCRDGNGIIKMLGDLWWYEHEGDCEELKIKHLLHLSPEEMLTALAQQDIDPEGCKSIIQKIALFILDRPYIDNAHSFYDEWLPQMINASENILHLAAQNGHFKVVDKLLKAGIEIDKADNWGMTALQLAAKYGHAELVGQLLADKWINVNQMTTTSATALHFAAEYGHADVVEKLLADERSNVNQVTSTGATALHLAALKGQVEVFRQLLADKSIKVNQKTIDGWTALHFAAEYGCADVVETLLAHKRINVNQKINDGWTALHIVARYGHADVIEKLLAHKRINRPLRKLSCA